MTLHPRRRFLPVLFALVLVALGGCHSRIPPPAVPPKAIVAYGDSITRGYGVPTGQGWVEQLSSCLQAKALPPGIAVFNAGGNGNTSREGLERIASDVVPHLPGLVFVEFGGNDAVEGKRHVSPEEFERNLLTIHDAVKGHGGEIVFVTFPPVIDSRHAFGTDPYFVAQGGLDRAVERYRQRTRDVAARLGSPLFDLDRLLRHKTEAKNKEELTAPDGVHLTAAANEVVAHMILEFLHNSGRLPENQ